MLRASIMGFAPPNDSALRAESLGTYLQTKVALKPCRSLWARRRRAGNDSPGCVQGHELWKQGSSSTSWRKTSVLRSQVI